MAIRVLLADDHKVVRKGLRMFLSFDDEFEVVGEAENGHQALELARTLRPDVILMDLVMPVMDGLTAIAAVRKELPEVEVIALTSVIDNRSVGDAVRAGAISYVLKDADEDELRRAILAAAAGQVRMSPRAAAQLVSEIRMPDGGQALTERENDVLRLIADGQANKEIAMRLSLSDQTVKTHVSSVLAKLGVQSRTQAALHAFRLGLVEPPKAT
jgi:DNA-binding NarL/FixJ family response regulator